MMISERRFNRRTFLQVASGSATLLIADVGRSANPQSEIRNPKSTGPNFLWISTEDINPIQQHGDLYAVTLNIDRLAGRAGGNNVFPIQASARRGRIITDVL
jgi:hypothetical protein